MNKKKWIKILIFIIILVSICSFCTYKFFEYAKNNEEFKINITEKGLVINDLVLKECNDEKISIEINVPKLWFDKKRFCTALSENQEINNDTIWQEINDDKCNLIITPSTKCIAMKDEKNRYKIFELEDYLNTIISLDVNIEDTLLLVGEKQEVEVSLVALGKPNKSINYIVEDEEVAKIENGIIIGVSNGKTNLEISDKYGHFKKLKIIVTNLITNPVINDNKPFLREKVYTSQQAKLLDEVLAFKIDKAGFSTRAGVVAAARFLSLEFMYKVPYFLENGRLQKHGDSDWIDGEGRYYHKGLYLSEDKYADIESSTVRPAMWGKYINEYSNDRVMPNGLDCSGFVSWAILNGGFDCGDIGAGPNYGYDVLTDLGDSQRITMNLLKSGKVRAGDLIGYDGHIGIIVGVEDANIYVADTILYTRGVCVTKYSYSNLIYYSGFTHIYDMTKYYKEEGNYTPMW